LPDFCLHLIEEVAVAVVGLDGLLLDLLHLLPAVADDAE
jgi:hypothetical protein